MVDKLPNMIRIDLGDGTGVQYQQMGEAQKHDPTAAAPVGPYGHGPAGLFGQAGQDYRVFSAVMKPLGGIMDQIPVVQNADDSGGAFGGLDAEFFSTISGVTQGALESFANQPTAACADGARGGLMKVGTLVSSFARYRFAPSAPIELFRAGRRRDIVDPTALQLANMASTQFTLGLPGLANGDGNSILVNELSRRMFEMGVSIQRFMCRRVYVGTPANNNIEARDLTGLDVHINAGNKVDAFTMNVITALDSDMKNFGSLMLHQNAFNRDIQNYAETMFGYLNWNATRQFGQPWDGVIAMRPELWDEITKVINVRQYQEALAQVAQQQYRNINAVIDMRQSLDFRDKMRADQLWPLRGRMVPVILDDGIAERDVTNNAALIAGQYSSDIYFINLRASGVPTTYWKYYNHANSNSEALAQIAGNTTFTSDGGMFRWYVNFRLGCLDFTVDFSPRLIVRAPQLCGRIQNVGYEPLQHFRSAFPDSTYFHDGGRTTGTTQNFYTPWSISTPVAIA